jgi:hypothetical protein
MRGVTLSLSGSYEGMYQVSDAEDVAGFLNMVFATTCAQMSASTCMYEVLEQALREDCDEIVVVIDCVDYYIYIAYTVSYVGHID